MVFQTIIFLNLSFQKLIKRYGIFLHFSLLQKKLLELRKGYEGAKPVINCVQPTQNNFQRAFESFYDGVVVLCSQAIDTNKVRFHIFSHFRFSDPSFRDAFWILQYLLYCGFCLSRILLYFHMCVRPSVRHRRDISPFHLYNVY